MIYWIAYYIFKLIGKVVFSLTFYGRKNIPAQGSYIFASNHLSNLDPMLIGLSVNRKVTYMAKHTLFKNKIFAFFLRKVCAFPIKRDTADVGALREAIKRLKAGMPLVVFPAGTRGHATSADGEGRSVQSGIGFLAAKSQVPVVPVYIVDSDKGLPPGAKWLRRHPIKIYFGQPMQFSKKYPYSEIAQRIMNEIDALAPAVSTSSLS